MAEIKVEHREKSGVGRWLLPLLLLGLVVAAVLAMRNRGEDRTVASTATPTVSAAGGEVAGGMIPVATIVGAPAQYANQTVSGTARVAQVVSDRGFWIEENGQRMFVVLGEKGAGTNAAEHAVDIKSGGTVRFTNAHVFTSADQVPGGNVEAEARQAIANQPAFLHVNPGDVQTVQQ